MSEGYNNTLEYKIDDNEYGYVMSQMPRIDARINPKQIFIPTFQANPEYPEIIETIPDQHSQALSDAIYCNDKDCRPMVDPIIYIRNYLTIYHHANDWFHHRWINRGARIVIEMHNKDLDHMRIIDHEDPSYCDDCTLEHPGCPWEEVNENGIYNPQ